LLSFILFKKNYYLFYFIFWSKWKNFKFFFNVCPPWGGLALAVAHPQGGGHGSGCVETDATHGCDRLIVGTMRFTIWSSRPLFVLHKAYRCLGKSGYKWHLVVVKNHPLAPHPGKGRSPLCMGGGVFAGSYFKKFTMPKTKNKYKLKQK
jgi:hypothetical protein